MKKLNPDTKLHIAITVNAEQDKKPEVWSSGAWQNVIFLYYLLKESKRFASVKLLNHAYNPAKQLEVVQGIYIPLHTLEEVKQNVDIVIVMGIQLGVENTKALRENGSKIVCFHVGNHYIINLENILFDIPERGGGEFDNTEVDEVWTLAHHENTCRSFFEVTLKAPVKIMPYLWNPLFIEHKIAQNNLHANFGYKAKDNNKHKIAIFEPNINIVKSCIYPMLIAELAYRENPDLIAGIHITNTAKFHKQKVFNQFAYTLDITKNSIASYDDRYDTPSFLSYYADIVLSHQWENGLNNLYYDVLYGRYPLVHNSPFLKHVGYYYEGFDAKSGAKALIQALSKHDTLAYDEACRSELQQVDIYNSDNLYEYEQAIFALVQN